MNMQELAAHEKAGLEPTEAEMWLSEVESIIGHSLDGELVQDGYSLDYAIEQFNSGVSSKYYAFCIITSRNG